MSHLSRAGAVCGVLLAVGLSAQVVSSTPVRGQRGMVTSAHPLASEAGVQMLQQGGNAVDAAVATTLAISVVEPFSAGIGGGGFLLMRWGQTGEIKALDFRERAPLAASRTMFLDAAGQVRPRASTDGYLAVATPGTVAGLFEVQRRYGQLPWATVVAPAVRLAQTGIPVTPHLAAAIARQPTLQQQPAARAIFAPQGQPLQVGDRLVQRDLAQTLQVIAQNPQAFYTGTIAQAIAQDMAVHRGLVTLADLQHYRPLWRQPVCGDFRRMRICSMPPPSSGGVHLLQILNIIGDTDLKAMGWHDPQALQLIIEAMRIAYADRAEYLGDPDFVTVPVAALINPGYGQLRRREILPDAALPFPSIRPASAAMLQRFGSPFPRSRKSSSTPRAIAVGHPLTPESTETSHLNTVDSAGNAVSLTFTINLGFGSGVVVPGTGIVLNNEMDDFAIAPDVPNAFGLVGRDANAIAPGKTPLSSMTPTIVTENNQLRLVVGAPGGSTIITTVLQVLLNVLVYDMDVTTAIAARRLHHQWLPDQLRVEPWGLDSLTLGELRRRGYQIRTGGTWGNASAIVRTANGTLAGAADPRGEGAVANY
ncbi:gamma-glutamyltranspeptidase [Neosynechococcus sphagnicola sy1]|uniref:Glutathione hydrolase proenzyme n=2 Tax=Neosynechococcus TaxID=1501143 RepID=A0A098TJI4_9CYAN|nr:gamma-glutamyltranspeptidase [Neosynechococcus sphagnicola sy1]